MDKTCEFITDVELGDFLGISRSTVWRWAKAGIIPQPRHLTPGFNRWSKSDLRNYHDIFESMIS